MQLACTYCYLGSTDMTLEYLVLDFSASEWCTQNSHRRDSEKDRVDLQPESRSCRPATWVQLYGQTQRETVQGRFPRPSGVSTHLRHTASPSSQFDSSIRLHLRRNGTTVGQRWSRLYMYVPHGADTGLTGFGWYLKLETNFWVTRWIQSLKEFAWLQTAQATEMVVQNPIIVPDCQK